MLLASSTAALTRSELEESLVRHLEGGSLDSARVLVRDHRDLVPNVVARLLIRRADALAAARKAETQAAPAVDRAPPASEAARNLDLAVRLTELHEATFGETVCRRLVETHRSLPDSAMSRVSRGWARFAEVDRLAKASRFVEVGAALPELRALAIGSGDPYLELYVFRLSGITWFSLARYDPAREQYEEALERARRLEDRSNERRLLANVAHTYLAQERYSDALTSLGEVLDAARSREDWSLVAWALTNIGNSARGMDRPDQARTAYEGAVAIARERGLRKSEAEALMFLSAVVSELGQTKDAIALAEEALEAAKDPSVRDQVVVLNAERELARQLTDLGQYSRALARLRAALPIARELGLVHQAASIHAGLGDVYRRVNQLDAAREQYRALLDIARETDIDVRRTYALRELAILEAERGDDETGIQLLEEAVAIDRASESPRGLYSSLLYLGWLRTKRGELEAADAALREGLSLAGGSPLILTYFDLVLGRVCSDRGDSAQAIAHYDRGIERARRHRFAPALVEVLAAKADFLRRTGELVAADSLLAAAIDTVEAIRAVQAAEEIRVGFLAAMRSVYAKRVGVLYELGRVSEHPESFHERAFAVAELARARALQEACGPALDELGWEPGDALADRARTLRATLRSAQIALSRAASADEWVAATVDSLTRLVTETAAAYREVTEDISTADPRRRTLTGSVSSLAIDELNTRVLEPDQWLVEYLVGDDETFTFVVGPNGFRCFRVPAGRDSLAGAVHRFREAMRNDRGAKMGTGAPQPEHHEAPPGVEEGRQLHHLLLGDVTRIVPDGARLLVSADGPILHLPFAALHDGERYLVERYAVAYAPSAGFVDLVLGARSAARGPSLLAVGNPSSYRMGTLLQEVRDAGRYRFGELLYAEEEARKVAAFFHDATVLTGPEATEERMKADVGRATYVHMAAHGLLDEGEPMLSGIALAQDDDPAEDGLLQVHEILDLELPGSIVVLSACNTGLGPIANGEGVIGLTRAFLHAGARAVFVSLWEVSDASTTGIMEAFYGAHLAGGLPLDVALQRAQCAHLASGGRPGEWAPFVVWGAVSPIRPHPGRAGLLLVGCALAAFGIVGAGITLHRVRRRDA